MSDFETIDFKTINFLAGGHVDDGKSTLIGRLLYDINVVPDDHIEAAKNSEGEIDYALFTDGLADERRQGITIDVAWRFFRYQGCRYRIADTPGHLEYMRNMAIAAVESDVAVILVDGIHGVRFQTVEYTKIARFFGVRRFLVAINKMDAVEYSEERFNAIKADYLEAFDDAEDTCEVDFIPVSALSGDNIVHPSANTPWYNGKTVLDYLKDAQRHVHANQNLRLPIQHLLKDEDGVRWYMGTLHGGDLSVGEKLCVLENDQEVTVSGLYHSGQSVQTAQRRSAIAMSVEENVDISRGALLARAQSKKAASVCDSFYADVLWIDKKYEDKQSAQGMIKLHMREEQAQIEIAGSHGLLKHGTVHLATPVALDVFSDNPRTGLFILTDAYSQKIIGVGTVTGLINEQNHMAEAI